MTVAWLLFVTFRHRDGFAWSPPVEAFRTFTAAKRAKEGYKTDRVMRRRGYQVTATRIQKYRAV